VLLNGDAVAATLALHLAVNNQLPAADVALHLAFTHHLNQMFFSLNVAGKLAVNIDMAAGDNIADEMHPAGDDRGLCFLLATVGDSGLFAGGVTTSEVWGSVLFFLINIALILFRWLWRRKATSAQAAARRAGTIALTDQAISARSQKKGRRLRRDTVCPLAAAGYSVSHQQRPGLPSTYPQFCHGDQGLAENW
jgi:hypothetical protein